MKSMKEKMMNAIDILIEEMEEIHQNKMKTPEDKALLPELANAIVTVTEYAVIEKK